MLIVADDLGQSPSVNAAIFDAFDRGLVTHASLMANQPAAEAACSEAAERGLVPAIGLHFVLTEGQALSSAMRASERFCDANGCFRAWRQQSPHLFWLASDDRRAVADELEAQIRRANELGVPLGYIDSHHHVHTEPAIIPFVLRAARRSGIERVRIGRNTGGDRSLANRAYKVVLNQTIGAAGLRGTRTFGTPGDHRGGDSAELMVHPVHDATGTLVEATGDHPALEPMLRRLGVVP